MEGEGNIRIEFVSFFRSRWVVDVDGEVSFALRDTINYVSDPKNRELIRPIRARRLGGHFGVWPRINTWGLMVFFYRSS